MLDAPPIDVDRALAVLGLVAAGGTGTGGGWLARRPQDEDAAYELLVVAAPLDDRLAERVDRYAALRHEHLAAVRCAVPIDLARTGVLVDRVRGVSLEAIRRTRAPLTDGECTTLLVPLSQALSSLGRAGLAHGAVDCQHVVLRPDGRPVLVGPRPGLLGTALPEDDLPRLLSTVVGVMPEVDGALVAGPSTVARLRPVLDDLLRDGCTPADVVDRCFATVDPEAVRLPDAAALAGASLLPGSRRPFPVSAGSRSRALAQPGPGRRDRRTARGGTRLGRRRTVVGVTAVALVVAAGTAGRQLLVHGPSEHVGTASAAEAVLDRADPARAAAELTRQRADVLARGGASALSRVAVAGGPSATFDQDVLASLGGRRLDGLAATVSQATVVGTATVDRADVSVTSAMSGYVSAGTDGVLSTVAPTPPRTVVLHLRWTDEGWRVWSVSEPTPAP